MAQTMDIESAYQRGFELRCEGRYSEARIELQKVLTAEPKHLKARWQLGLIQGFEGDFEASYSTLSDLAETYPKDAQIRFDLAMTQMMLGMNDEACLNFIEAVKLDPNGELADKARKQLEYF